MTPEEYALEVGKEAIKQAFQPVQEIVRQVAGPAATEVGLMWGDALRAWRAKRAVRLFDDVMKVMSARHLKPNPVAPRLLFPILDAATLNEDEDLHTRWVALLTNAATTDKGIHPSFSGILTQLTPEEVRFLDRAYDEVTLAEQNREIQNRTPLLSGYDYLMHPVRQSTLELIDTVTFDNLSRLVLLRRDSGVYVSGGEPSTSFEQEVSQELENAVYLTELGRAFICACRLPRSKQPACSC
jgi:Abortive infection alpha